MFVCLNLHTIYIPGNNSDPDTLSGCSGSAGCRGCKFSHRLRLYRLQGELEGGWPFFGTTRIWNCYVWMEPFHTGYPRQNRQRQLWIKYITSFVWSFSAETLFYNTSFSLLLILLGRQLVLSLNCKCVWRSANCKLITRAIGSRPFPLQTEQCSNASTWGPHGAVQWSESTFFSNRRRKEETRLTVNSDKTNICQRIFFF